MSLNPFSVRYVPPEVKLMYLLRSAHAQILSSQISLKMMSRSRNDLLYGKTGALNSNMTPDFKPEVVVWSKLHMRSKNR